MHTPRATYSGSRRIVYGRTTWFIAAQILLSNGLVAASHPSVLTAISLHVMQSFGAGCKFIVCWASFVNLQVYRTAWWMAHYNARSAKRHQGLSNNRWVEKYNRGKLLKHQRRPDPSFRSSKTYKDSQGRRRWQGTKQLKETQQGP